MLKRNFFLVFLFLIILCVQLNFATGNAKKTGNFDSITPRAFETQIKKFFEDIRNRMCRPIPSLFIPTLDPLYLEKFSFNFTHPVASLDGKIQDTTAKGLGQNLVLNKGSLNIIGLVFDLDVTLTELHLFGTYEAKGDFGGIFPIDGYGKLDVRVHGVNVQIKGKVNFANETFSFKELSVVPKIDKITGHIDNIVPSEVVSEYVNEVINKHGAELVDSLWDDYGETVTEMAKKLMSEMAGDLTLTKILAIINGSESIFDPEDPPADCYI